MKFPSVNYKSLVKMLVKIVLAGAILYWLVSQNKLDFRLVGKSFQNPALWFTCFAILAVQIVVGAIRWRLILKTKNVEISLLEIVRIQWIGQFFSVVLPGAVTGDLVKIGYITSLKKDISKKFLLLSIFIDRLAGLNALLLLAGLASAIFYKDLIELNPLLKGVIFVNIILFLGSCGVLTLFFLNKNIQGKIKKIIPSKKIVTILETIWSFSDHKKEMSQAIILSAFTHIMSIAVFWAINLPFFEKPVQIKYLLSLVPLGQVAIAIPISPAGLGVGHAAFERLFHFIGHSNGASLFNVFWVLLFAVNLCGILPFLISKEPIQNTKLQESSL